MEKIFGAVELLSGDGTKISVSDINADAIAIYFSAHWCPPCRGFTPEFAKSYKQLKEQGKSFEVIFVSSDRDQSSFDDYFKEMPWLALPYEHRDLKNEISKRFKVQGIPSLLLFDKDGNLYNKNGRSAVSQLDAFPWKPPTVEECFAEIVNHANEPVSLESLRGPGKFIGVYHSAHWCPPCRGFTPELIKSYPKIKSVVGEGNFEIIFVSGDRDEDQFKSYFADMPWLAVSYGSKHRKSIGELFEVEGIPSFQILDGETLKVVCQDARSAVSEDPEGKEFPWPLKPVLSLDTGVDYLQQGVASLVIFAEKMEESAKEALEKGLKPLGQEHFLDYVNRDEDPKMALLIAKKDGRLAQRVRAVATVKADTAAIIIKGQSFFTMSDATGELTTAKVVEFVNDYFDGKCEEKALQF